MKRSYLATIADFIPRPRIDALIEAGAKYPLTLVMAGPGYGKTLSVAHYMKTADVRLIWLRAASHHRRVADFWSDFTQAAARELPDYAHQLEELGFPDSPLAFAQFRAVTAEAASSGARLVMVLDRYERILEEKTVDFFNRLIDSELPNFTLFILCNVKLPFADVLPAAGIFRISDRDLAFDLAETEKMLAHYNRATSRAVAEQARRVTCGWPLGLRLICQAGPQPPEHYFSGTSMQLAADLYDRHYFANYSKQVRKRLILFSLLPQFSLDMMRDEDETDYADLQALLMSHPFVYYDYATGLFTFQSMYHEFLLHRQTLLSLESRREMRAAAAAWFLSHQMVNEAMDCYWEAADYDGFMLAVAHMPKIHTRTSFTGRILQRLEQIPRDYAEAHPAVDFSIAFMHLNAAEVERAKDMLLAVEARLHTAPQTEEVQLLRGDIYATLADISVFQNDDTGLAWVQKAAELLPNGSRVHSPALYSIGNNTTFFLPRNEAGELARMVDYVMAFAQYSDRVKNGCGFGYEYLFAGEAAYYQEDMENASILFNSAILKAQRTSQHDIICNAYLGLIRIEFYYGNQKNALELLATIERYIETSRAVGLHELRDCARAFVYMSLGDLPRVPAWFGETMTGPDELPVLLGRKQLTSAYYLYLTGETAKAYALVLQLEAMLAHKGRWCEKLWLYILQAQHHAEAGEQALFLQAFQKAYDMVYANDLKLALSCFGKGMMALIDRVRREDTGTFDIEWLDAMYRDCLSYAKRQQMMRRAYRGELYGHAVSKLALTARENETLRYLAQGLTQSEIGKLMGISTNAVKKHVSKIYYKLGAVNRADAIHIASINGLVDVINT